MQLDYAEEHTLRLAALKGSLTAQVCRDGEPCEEGEAHLALYEGMVRRGLLHLTRLRGSVFSEFEATEAGLALLDLREKLLEAEARLESTVDVLNNLADELHAAGFKDRRGHRVENLAALKNADRLLDQISKTPA